MHVLAGTDNEAFMEEGIENEEIGNNYSGDEHADNESSISEGTSTQFCLQDSSNTRNKINDNTCPSSTVEVKGRG